jgi:hypothetical protein
VLGTDRSDAALGTRGLAALYAGTPLRSLRQVTLVSGGSAEHDAALDVAFAGTATCSTRSESQFTQHAAPVRDQDAARR